MYFDDLSPYTYSIPKNLPDGFDLGELANALNVGWLARGYPFPTGPTSLRFRSKLRKQARNVQNPAFGFHECDLCGWRPWIKANGNGEIHVAGPDGIVYVAPQLILHYISRHKYLPPQQFIDAVLENGR